MESGKRNSFIPINLAIILFLLIGGSAAFAYSTRQLANEFGPKKASQVEKRVDNNQIDAPKKDLKHAGSPSQKDGLALAENFYFEALRVFKKHHGDRHISIVGVNCRVAMVMADRGRFEELTPYYKACGNPPESIDKGQLLAIRGLEQYVEKSIAQQSANQD